MTTKGAILLGVLVAAAASAAAGAGSAPCFAPGGPPSRPRRAAAAAAAAPAVRPDDSLAPPEPPRGPRGGTAARARAPRPLAAADPSEPESERGTDAKTKTKSRGDRDDVRRRLAKKCSRWIPRSDGEVAGITTGLGLWGEVRRRAGRRRRRLLDAWRNRRKGRRRRALASRLRSHFKRDKKRGLSRREGEDEDDDEEREEEEGLMTDLDAMRARAGVLRTRIRIRQESLAELEVLTRDVRLEVKRGGWQTSFGADGGYANRTTFMYGQASDKGSSGEDETEDVMNERKLEELNKKWKERRASELKAEPLAQPSTADGRSHRSGLDRDDSSTENFQLDVLESRSQKLENSVLLDRIRLQRLERRVACLEATELGFVERYAGRALEVLDDLELSEDSPLIALRRGTTKFVNTFAGSTSNLLRKLERVSSRTGLNNREYASVTDFVRREASAGVRIVGGLLSNPSRLTQLVDPDTPALVPHVPAILARLDRLESHVAPILSRVLNNQRHLRSIEPYLGEILERFDDIEPHLPWILDHIDVLAPYTGLLLKHVDELLLYAEVDEYEGSDGDDNYAFAEQLLPYLEVYVRSLDLVGPHLPLLRPHLPLLLKHDRIGVLSPHVGVLFAKGYKDLSASANMDILLFYFGWALRVPYLPRIFFSLPASPGMVSFLANRLPKRLVRGRTCDVTCYVDGDYGKGWNELSK